MKVEQLKQKISTPECYDFVIKRLSDVDNLIHGIVAGQAVSSAIIEYLEMDNLINPIYNDIDVFKPLSKTFVYENKENNFFKSLAKRENLTSTGFINISELASYGDFTFKLKTENRILGSFRKKEINKTFIQVPDSIYYSKDILVLDIISSFDINSTQVGFYYGKSEKIVFTDNFIEFLYTKELKVSKWETPIHTLLRMDKKGQEFGNNVFSNIEETTMLSLVYANSIRNMSNFVEQGSIKQSFSTDIISKIPLNFGKKHKEIIENSNLLDNLKLIEAGKFHSLDFLTTEIKNKTLNKFEKNLLHFDNGFSFGTESRFNLLNDILYGFEPNKESYPLELKSQFFHSFIAFLPSIYLSSKNTRKKTKLYVAKKYHNIEELNKNISNGDRINNRNINDGEHKKINRDEMNYLINSSQITINDYQTMDKFKPLFKKHPRLSNYFSFSGFSLDKQVIMINNLIKVDKETDVLIGLVESNINNVSPHSLLSLEDTRRIAENYLKDLDKKIKERIIDFETEDYKVKEIITKLELKDEGKTMNHCVAGYGNSIKSGHSLIIQFIPKNNKGTRCTMELSPSLNDNSLSLFNKKFSLTKRNYYISQVRGKSNKSVVLDTSLYYAFEKINSNFDFLPISFTEHNSFEDISKEVRTNFSKSVILNNKGKILKYLFSNKYAFKAGNIFSKGLPGFHKNKKNRNEIISLVWKYNKYASHLSGILLNPLLSYKSDEVLKYFWNNHTVDKLNYEEFLKIDSIYDYYHPEFEEKIEPQDFIPEIRGLDIDIGPVQNNNIPWQNQEDIPF